MGHAGEQPPEVPPQPVGESVRLEAHASDQARVNQAARDLHVHYGEGVRAEPGTATAECPYPGLASFGREQARWFFGREQLIADLIACLDRRLRTGGVQAVVAPSGAGKSSLLHAGLLPKLDNGALPGSDQWPTVVFTPTAQPLQALAMQIAALTGADPVTLAEQLAADSRQAGVVPLGSICGVDSGTRLVMVVDQFEELFTLCTDDRQRHTFIELLTRIATSRSDTSPDPQPVGLVVIGVRADFCAACTDYSHLRTALQDSPLVVGPMSDAELRGHLVPGAGGGPRHRAGLDRIAVAGHRGQCRCCGSRRDGQL
jgi:Novel STAND NTPase 1